MAKRFRLTWNLSTSWFGKQHQNASAFSRYLAAGKWISLFLVTLLLSLSCSGLGTVNAASTLQPPLSTAGAQIVDATGRAVLLRGVNWFGMETDLQAPHGLWARDYKAMLAQIRNLGYNMIRLPYSVQGLRASTISGVDFSIGSNRDLQNKTPLAVMDVIIQEAQRQGLLVLLDSHRLNNQRIPELWYGDGFTEADWIDTWKLLATRYKTQPNVIGADLKNEPHGRASWGTNDLATDWRLAAERAGNAILAINPDWLIVVEGVEKNVPGQQLAVHWQGGNLEGVKRFPVRLRNPRKLVYSPHEYGPGVFNQGWFNEPTFPQNLLNRWETGFYYIARQKIAPILIGEFGGRQVDRTSKEGIWQRQLVDYIQQQNLSFAYWSWNPNSSDTGGILLDDWNTVDQPKQQLLSPLLPAPGLPMTATQPNPLPSPLPTSPPSASPKPQPTPSPQPSSPLQPLPSPAPPASGNTLKLETKLQSDWQTGFCIAMQVTNQGKTASGNWRLTFQMNQAAIASSWNGTFNRQGTFYTVIPPDWGRTLQPGQVVDMGFCATKLGADYQPKQLLIANP